MIQLPFVESDEVRAAVAQAAEVRAGGGVILLPTETYYGLGVDPENRTAVDRIFAIKARPPAQALPVLVADWQQLEALVEVPERYRRKLSRIWPGPLTVILPSRKSLAAAPGSNLAVRLPGHDQLRALLYRTGPLTGTSANRHGEPPTTTTSAALRSMVEAPDLVLNGGETAAGGASTLVDLCGSEAVVLRLGSTPWDDSNPLS